MITSNLRKLKMNEIITMFFKRDNVETYHEHKMESSSDVTGSLKQKEFFL